MEKRRGDENRDEICWIEIQYVDQLTKSLIVANFNFSGQL